MARNCSNHCDERKPTSAWPEPDLGPLLLGGEDGGLEEGWELGEASDLTALIGWEQREA